MTTKMTTTRFGFEALVDAVGSAHVAEMTYYAVCDAGGPISVRLEETEDAAIAAFGAGDKRAWIDAASADAEDDLGLDGTGMDEGTFAAALEAAGGEMILDLDEVIAAHAGTVAHLAGGWRLWRNPRPCSRSRATTPAAITTRPWTSGSRAPSRRRMAARHVALSEPSTTSRGGHRDDPPVDTSSRSPR
jgi:hypothetical protein